MTVHGGWLDEPDVEVPGQVPLPGMPDDVAPGEVEERPQ
jgi:hypothetical protein